MPLRATLSPPLPNNPSSLILDYKFFCIRQIADSLLSSPLIHFDALFSSSTSLHLLARLYGPVCGLIGSPHLEGLYFFISPSRILACLHSSGPFRKPGLTSPGITVIDPTLQRREVERKHGWFSHNLPCSFQRKRNWGSRTIRYSQCPWVEDLNSDLIDSRSYPLCSATHAFLAHLVISHFYYSVVKGVLNSKQRPCLFQKCSQFMWLPYMQRERMSINTSLLNGLREINT